MNLMESGLRFLVEQRIATSSVPATYQTARKDYDVRAVPCKSAKHQNENDVMDLTIEANTLDFIIPSTDLPVDPQRGDLIIANGKVYEVNNYSAGSSVGTVAWFWCEGCYEVARRIHTKCVGLEDEFSG